MGLLCKRMECVCICASFESATSRGGVVADVSKVSACDPLHCLNPGERAHVNAMLHSFSGCLMHRNCGASSLNSASESTPSMCIKWESLTSLRLVQ